MADLSKELNKELSKDFAYCEDALGRAENAIGNLPSVQPEKRTEERTKTHACDLIDRQAVIDALDEQIALCDEALKSFEISMRDEYAVKVERASLVAFREKLEYLQPAQPETATVTIGRTRGSVTMWYECDACGEPVDQKDNYCRKCGRKLKHE